MKIRKLQSRTIYKGRVFHFTTVKLQAPGGRKFEHQIVRHPGAAVIIPVLRPKRFLMVRQYRTPLERVLWEFPAGTLDAGESPLACAKREIIEEVGYEASRWEKLASFYPAPGMSTERMHLFLASDLKPKRMSLDHDEFLVRRVVSFARLQKMILNGMIQDAKTVLGFFYYCRHEKIKC